MEFWSGHRQEYDGNTMYVEYEVEKIEENEPETHREGRLNE